MKLNHFGSDYSLIRYFNFLLMCTNTEKYTNPKYIAQ